MEDNQTKKRQMEDGDVHFSFKKTKQDEEISVDSSTIPLIMKWSGKEYPLHIRSNQTFGGLKAQMYIVTAVLPIRFVSF
jgi:hypothetical protein